MTFKAPDSLSEQIAQHLGEQIITGELNPGHRIQELRIAGELNVSRGSVREAFLLLDRRHLIEIIPRRGAVVAALSSKQVREIYEAITIMLGVIVKNAAEKWQEGDLDDFFNMLETMNGYVQAHQVKEYFEASFHFNRLAYRFLDNEFLVETMEDLLPSIRRAYYLALSIEHSEMAKSFTMFQEILESVAARNGERAAQVIEEFSYHQRDLVLASLKVADKAETKQSA